MPNCSTSILRAIRKQRRITQTELGDLLQTTQGAVSKIESGILEMSAFQWIRVCNHFEIDMNSLVTGKIESLGEDKTAQLRNFISRIGSFKIPDKYTMYAASTARSVYPLLRFMEVKLGANTKNEFIKSLKIDPDYFVIMNNPINLVLIQDIVAALTQKGVLSSSNIHEILTTVPTQEVHGHTLKEIGNKSAIITMRKFVDKINLYYENNTAYRFDGHSKSFSIRGIDNEHVKELGLTDDFRSFRKIFAQSHFETLKNHLNIQTGPLQISEIPNGWILKGAS